MLVRINPRRNRRGLYVISHYDYISRNTNDSLAHLFHTSIIENPAGGATTSTLTVSIRLPTDIPLPSDDSVVQKLDTNAILVA